jgi:hypothetical protein
MPLNRPKAARTVARTVSAARTTARTWAPASADATLTEIHQAATPMKHMLRKLIHIAHPNCFQAPPYAPNPDKPRNIKVTMVTIAALHRRSELIADAGTAVVVQPSCSRWPRSKLGGPVGSSVTARSERNAPGPQATKKRVRQIHSVRKTGSAYATAMPFPSHPKKKNASG